MLKGADLQRCNLDGAILANVNLEGADMRNSKYNVQELWKANFKDAKLRGDNIISSSYGGYSGELIIWGNIFNT